MLGNMQSPETSQGFLYAAAEKSEVYCRSYRPDKQLEVAKLIPPTEDSRGGDADSMLTPC